MLRVESFENCTVDHQVVEFCVVACNVFASQRETVRRLEVDHLVLKDGLLHKPTPLVQWLRRRLTIIRLAFAFMFSCSEYELLTDDKDEVGVQRVRSYLTES